MKNTFYSNWTSVMLAAAGFASIFLYARGFDKGVQIGSLIAIGYIFWLSWERYYAYVVIEENRWLINSKQQSYSTNKIDVASILYITRAPNFVFRSWGGRMMIFFRDDDGQVKQTALPESLYSWENLQGILKTVISIKPNIELDDQYRSLVSKKDPADAELSQSLPGSMKEIENYVSEKYGPPETIL